MGLGTKRIYFNIPVPRIFGWGHTWAKTHTLWGGGSKAHNGGVVVGVYGSIYLWGMWGVFDGFTKYILKRYLAYDTRPKFWAFLSSLCPPPPGTHKFGLTGWVLRFMIPEINGGAEGPLPAPMTMGPGTGMGGHVSNACFKRPVFLPIMGFQIM